MRKQHIIVVGNGLFGSIAARWARLQGHEVTIVSNNHPNAASKASGCVFAPSWLSSLDKEQRHVGLTMLESLYTIRNESFHTHAGLAFRAQRVDLADILLPADIVGHAMNVRDGTLDVETAPASIQRLRGVILLATGFWTNELHLPGVPTVRGLYGASIMFKGAKLPEPQMRTWAPYKQAVGFQLDSNRVWFGDGTALVEHTWKRESAQRIKDTMNRGLDMILPHTGLAKNWPATAEGLRRTAEVRVGVRPYVEGHKAGYLKRVYTKTWLTTGGAKNGTVLAAAQAAQFLKELTA